MNGTRNQMIENSLHVVERNFIQVRTGADIRTYIQFKG
jgi:hypothetical protein